MKQRGLGKGLSALLSDVIVNEEGVQIRDIPIIDIEPNPWQPRKVFNEINIKELSESISIHGVIQPIIVQENGTKYTIIAGERRWRAARVAGLTEIPAIVRLFSHQESLEIALIENIQRQDLNTIELACAYQYLGDQFSLTQEEISNKVGKSRSSVANIMRLLKLSPYVQEKVSDGAISYGHARAILGIEDEKGQCEITDEVIASQLSVRETEKLIQKLSEIKEEKEKIPVNNPFYKEIQEGLQHILGTKVHITQGKKKGKIEIEYYSEDELERIIHLIKK
ncbi:MAG TPA: ParB/RepB/Spo0J family partition protein [Epulopiscium sp.]|nr:ParB/RepB/Spo0J family partition protein [Candidatus Epulonipiscium sp.]